MPLDLERLREAARGAQPASGELRRPRRPRAPRGPSSDGPATVTPIPRSDDTGIGWNWKNMLVMFVIGWFIAAKCSGDKPASPAAGQPEQTQAEAAADVAAAGTAPAAPRAGTTATVAELPPLLDPNPPEAGPRLATQDVLQAEASRLPTRSGLLRIVDAGGRQRLELDGTRLDGPQGAAIRLLHRAVYADREVVTGVSGCSRAGPGCRPDTPFFVLMRDGSPARVLQGEGLTVTEGFGAVAADATGVSVDLGIDRGTQWRATLTTRDGIHVGSGPAAVRALDDAQCAEVSLALRECSSTEASTCAVPRASASQLTAVRRNALTRLYNTTTGFDQGGFLALCSAACAERAAPSPQRVFVEACSGADAAQWATPSLPWLPGAPPVVVPATASTGSTGAAGAAAAAETTAAATAEPGAGPVDAQARMDRSRSPPLDAFYPSAARRDGITGATVVQVCTDASGKLRGEPTIGESSGSSALDAAALRWASFASFVPATRDGSPVAACFSFRVRFDLTD